ncbi:hypothetical protein [Leyella stercorea]|uniref:hypothetical protein n=1 Tax=Leyella stercorea TaxID=363265 RepID=UPI00266CC985|nr:hypothetical protein [Leyella stercorea]
MHQPSKKCANQARSAPTALLVQQRLLHPLISAPTTVPPGTSASTVADICVDRCGHPRRPLQTSASTVADIRVDRCGHLRRPMQTSASTDA